MVRTELPYHFRDGRGGTIETGMARFGRVLERFPGLLDPQTIQKTVEEATAELAAELDDLVQGHDAFDLIESQRMHEYPILGVPRSHEEAMAEGTPLAVELVALASMARGAREPNRASEEQVGAVAEKVRFVAEALTFVTMWSLLHNQMETGDPIADLAANVHGAELFVRNKQYATIRQTLDDALFGQDNVSSAMQETLGFTYADVKSVRAAIEAHQQTHMTDAFGALRESHQAWLAGDPKAVDRGRAAGAALFLRPGERASFTAEQIAAASDVSLETTEVILGHFSVGFSATPTAKSLAEIVAGKIAFTGISLLRDDAGNYLQFGGPLGDDNLRALVEGAVLGSKSGERYVRARTRMSEETAIEYLTAAFSPTSVHPSLKYYAPLAEGAEAALSREATELTTIGKLTEADALLLIDDVAICLEVKGKSLRADARLGHRKKLASDLASTVGDATKQADRLRRLITLNGGLWTERGWLDLDMVREVHSVAVTLDDLGPTGIAIDSLIRSGVISTDTLPWLVSLHDLAVITSTVARPAELLLYLRRRTQTELARVLEGVDELDVFMYFMGGDLFFEPDPDRTYAANPEGRRAPTERERQRYREQFARLHIGTHTDPLDAWMTSIELDEPDETLRPRFASGQALDALASEINEARNFGWLRASTAILSLSSSTQSVAAGHIRRAAERTRQDSGSHSFTTAISDERGTFALMVMTHPDGSDFEKDSVRLSLYQQAKTYQLHASHSLAIMTDQRNQVLQTTYLNPIWQHDEELEDLVATMGLIPASRSASSIPPSARRTTKRLKPKSGRKRRR